MRFIPWEKKGKTAEDDARQLIDEADSLRLKDKQDQVMCLTSKLSKNKRNKKIGLIKKITCSNHQLPKSKYFVLL